MPGTGHVSLMALKRLGLDRVWWIVTPGNPLKDSEELAAMAMRVRDARQVSDDPRIDVTAFEQDIGARYTVDTLAYLKRRFPDVHFVWIMGADNLAGFHRWRGWRRIARMMPMAVIDRPGWTLKAVRSKAPSPCPAAGSGKPMPVPCRTSRRPPGCSCTGLAPISPPPQLRRLRRTSATGRH